MSRNYYLLKSGRVRREKNTVYIEDAEGKKTPLPVENIESLYLYGEIDLNTRLLDFPVEEANHAPCVQLLWVLFRQLLSARLSA